MGSRRLYRAACSSVIVGLHAVFVAPTFAILIPLKGNDEIIILSTFPCDSYWAFTNTLPVFKHMILKRLI